MEQLSNANCYAESEVVNQVRLNKNNFETLMDNMRK